MLSTFPTSSQSMLENPFPSFDGASTPWECNDYDYDLMSTMFKLPEPSGLDVLFHSPKQVISSSSSENQYEPDEKTEAIDERKRRRKELNRESAKRSRLRKQMHEENLKNLVNKLSVENQEMSNRLRFTLNHVNRVRMENDHLTTENTILGQKLLYIRQALIIRQLQRQIPVSNLSQLQYNLNNNNNNYLISS